MSEERLATELWVSAHIRRCHVEGISTYVIRRGEPLRGSVLLKINRLEQGWRLLAQIRDLEGRLGWLEALAGAREADAESDAYVERAVRRDPDLWVLEIEDRLGRNPFEGRTL